MERLLYENVNCMWLSGMSSPDFRTINRFRSESLCDGRFEELFRQTVANKYIFVWKGSVEKNNAMWRRSRNLDRAMLPPPEKRVRPKICFWVGLVKIVNPDQVSAMRPEAIR